jgi:hypothetical protein
MPVLLWLPARRHLATSGDEAAALRHWIRYGTRLPDASAGEKALLETAFSALDQPLATAAWTRAFDAPDDCSGRWLRADPCHLRVEPSGVRMLACGAMALSLDDANAYADSVRSLFDDAGWRLHVASPGRWYVQPDAGAAAIGGEAPEHVLGAYIDAALPAGDAGRATRLLLNEVQMALHQHPRDKVRRERGLPAVNSLWLHGDGVRCAAPVCRVEQVSSGDPLLCALTQAAGKRVVDGREGPYDAMLIDARAPGAEFALALNELLAADVPVNLCLESGERFHYRPWHRWRVWRRDA